VTARRLALDFVDARRAVTLGGGVLLAVGIGAAVAAVYDYRSVAGRVAVLELRQTDLAPPPAVAAGPATTLGLQEASAVVLELQTPWATLLQQLESAGKESRDSVALLAIEPDPAANRVRLVAEARTLAAALEYVRRLQACSTLRNPLLQSHEINTRDRERPVRFEVAADWRAQT